MNATALAADAGFAALESALADELDAIARQYRRAALASSLSLEDMVLADAIFDRRLPIDVFVIDTGELHAETLALLERAQARYGRRIGVFRPDPAALAAFVTEHGRQAFYRSVDLRLRCCALRKVEPLGRALAGRDAWLTGQRRAHGPERADLALRETDGARGIAKFNPLALWPDGAVRAYVERRRVPYNPLHDRGYPSIGCAPCTRAIRPGEPMRAGRWWWESEGHRKECGLHLPAAANAVPATETHPQ